MSGRWKESVALCAACLVALVLLERALRPDHRQRNYEVFSEMAHSLALESQGPSAHLPGGLTQQPIVEGVVVRGRLPFPYGPGPEEAQRAGRELTNPFGDEPHVLDRGGRLFQRFCAVCHGGDGAGAGRAVARGMVPPPPLQAARALAMADGEMFHVLTLGQGNMASYADQLAPEDRWKVIRYVRSLQEPTQ